MFTALEGVELIGADPGAEEFEVDIEPGKERVTLEVPVARLHEIVPALDAAPVNIEHLYDY